MQPDAMLLRHAAPTTVQRLVVMGDSTSVGVGDPVPGRTWRGFGPLLADALGGTDRVQLTNLATTGARVGDVYRRQLPAALAQRPDAVILVVGMNDSMRSDFSPRRLHDDFDRTVARLRALGTTVVTVRYHDHGKVFHLPKPLHRLLRKRIGVLNEISSTVCVRHGAQCVDLDQLPGAYERPTWSVDRLHPSEQGHRMLAAAFADALRTAGHDVPHEVSRLCAGGFTPSTAEHVAWLILKGLPWLWRRGHDLVPYACGVLLRSYLGLDQRANYAAAELALLPSPSSVEYS